MLAQSSGSETPRAVALQASLCIELSGQEYWIGLPFPLPADLPNPGIKPASSALAGRFFTTEPPGKLTVLYRMVNKVKAFFWTNLQQYPRAAGSSGFGVRQRGVPLLPLVRFSSVTLGSEFTSLGLRASSAPCGVQVFTS